MPEPESVTVSVTVLEEPVPLVGLLAYKDTLIYPDPADRRKPSVYAVDIEWGTQIRPLME